MIKQDITYTNFDDETVTETFYFHLASKKLAQLEADTNGAFSEKLKRVGSSANGAEIIQTFTELVGHAYGLRTEGVGGTFKQSPELSADFLDSLAFDALLTKLLTDVEAATVFVNGVMPKEFMEIVAKAGKEGTTVVALPDDGKVEIEGVQYTHEEFVRLTNLKHPFDDNGQPLPWALREPTMKEFGTMTTIQRGEAFHRKGTGWIPTPAKV
jgi:hypothetical protein